MYKKDIQLQHPGSMFKCLCCSKILENQSNTHTSCMLTKMKFGAPSGWKKNPPKYRLVKANAIFAVFFFKLVFKISFIFVITALVRQTDSGKSNTHQSFLTDDRSTN